MMETRRRVSLLGCLLVTVVLLAVPACGRQGGKEMDEMVNIGTHSLHVRCTGSGEPTVVIDTGAGDLAAKWYGVQDQLAQVAHVCTYDRAGYGQSEPGPMPRHVQQAASELKLLLEKAGLKGPYVLVGHSLGGLNLQVFADQYPDLVAGLVLLDPAPRDFISGKAFPDLYQMFKQAGAEMQTTAEGLRASSNAEERAKADYVAAVASEHQSMVADGAAQVAAVASLRDIPLTVVASGKPNPAFGDEAQAYQAFWIEQSRALAERSTNGTFILVQESGHHLQVDAPDVVVAAIRETVAKVQK
jgi:pimeloyl-ACP methyl ester carboxylesterase